MTITFSGTGSRIPVPVRRPRTAVRPHRGGDAIYLVQAAVRRLATGAPPPSRSPRGLVWHGVRGRRDRGLHESSLGTARTGVGGRVPIRPRPPEPRPLCRLPRGEPAAVVPQPAVATPSVPWTQARGNRTTNEQEPRRPCDGPQAPGSPTERTG